ncbi:MAG: efflux RND transporter periplasmic adaptor subunit, partial [Brevinematales bacterium]
VNALDAGTIVKIYSDFNKKVYKGQVMAKIDDTAFKASLDQAVANLHSVQSSLSQAQQNYDDTKALFDQNFTAQSNLEASKNILDSSKAMVEVARAQVETAQVNYSNCDIYAPMSGVVVQRNIDVGNAVGSLSYAGLPLFVIAADTGRMQIVASVAESDIGVVRRGQKARFTLQAYMDKTFDGTVHDIYVMPALVQNVVNYQVIIDVDNSKGLFFPGMTATIDIVTDKKTNILEIPNSALKFHPTSEVLRQIFGGGQKRRPGGTGSSSTNQAGTVMLLIYNEDTGRIAPIRAKIGLSDGVMTEIDSDKISEGMMVVSGISLSNQPSQPQPGRIPGVGVPGMGGGMGR